jgi:hypothetical protein
MTGVKEIQPMLRRFKETEPLLVLSLLFCDFFFIILTTVFSRNSNFGAKCFEVLVEGSKKN